MFLKLRPKSVLRTSLFLLFAAAFNITSIMAQGETCKPFAFNLVPSFQAGKNTFSYTSNDFNGDNLPDVAVVNAEIRTVSVLYGDGAGGFSAPHPFATELNPSRITSGDLNSDGKHDLIVGSFYENKLAILLNNGTGGFGAPNIFVPPSQFPNQGEFMDLKTADFNGDGKLDLVAAQYAQNKQLKFFLGNGQGALTLATSLTLTGDDATVAVGNLNGDNLPDIAVAGGSSFTARYVSFVYGRQDAQFALTFGFNLTDRAVGIKIADLDNDSDNDLAVAFEDVTTPTTHSLQAWLNNGGSFSGAPRLDVLYFLPPSDVTTGDFNNDGKQDLAAPVSSPYFSGVMMLVTFGNGNGTYQEPRYYAMPAYTTKAFTSDANGDSKPDIVSVQTASSSSQGAPTGSISVLLNDNYVDFKAPKAVAWGTTDIAAADFNNDNLKDFVSGWDTSFAQSSEVVIALNDGSEGLLPDRNFTSPFAMQAIAVGDFNGDGKKDAVSVHSNNGRKVALYLGDGTGNLAAPVSTDWATGVENVVAGDFNNDGRDDVFIIDSNQKGSTLLGNANGTLTLVQNFTVNTANYFFKPLKGDFNEDGKLDLVISDGTSVVLWLGAGDGTFTQGATQPLLASQTGAAVGDFNGDGNLDIAGASGGGITKYYGNGGGQFNSGSNQQYSGGDISSIVAADFNLDGLDDIAFITSHIRGNLAVLPSAVQVVLPATPIFYSVGGLGRTLLAEDYNADGKPDIGYASQYQSRGIIYNTSSHSPCLSVDDVSVTEGDAGGSVNANFTVTLSAAAAQDVYVNYSLESLTATIGTDVQNTLGRLRIPAGQTSGNIAVPVTGDATDEFNEAFLLRLASPSNAALLKGEGIGTIVDNDAEPTLTISDVTQAEGFFSQSFTFNVALSAPSGKPISFRYATADGTAVGTSDYTPASNVINIAPGATTAFIGVFVAGDSTHELTEDFFVNLSEQNNVTFADAQGKGTITNDDAVPTVGLQTSVITEGDTGTTTSNVVVQLSNPTYLPVTLNVLTSDGTAVSGRDYVASDVAVTIPAEQSSATTPIQVLGDTINEPGETFNANIYNLTNATVSSPQFMILIVDDEPVANDFDRDGKTDLAVFRPSNRNWYFNLSQFNSSSSTTYGLSDDFPVAGDYNGDGRTDIGVFRSSNSVWYTPIAGRTQQFGLAGDVPAPGDYDNDGRLDLAVFRPSDLLWYIQRSSNGAVDYVQFGLANDKPVPADYDGDGKTDVAVFRPETGVWYILRSTDLGYSVFAFGQSGDKLVPADYDGDGKADIAVWRAGVWHVMRSSDLGVTAFQWGLETDKPVPGNYDGDSKTDYAVYRDGAWWIWLSSTDNYIVKQFGLAEDTPIPFVSNN